MTASDGGHRRAVSAHRPSRSTESPAVRGVLFDVDDTVFDHTGATRDGFLAYLRQLGCRRDPVQAYRHWLRITDEEYARFDAGLCDLDGQRRSRARRMAHWLGAPLEPGHAAADHWFAGHLYHYEAAWRAFPDAAPALAALAPELRLGVVSNAGHDQQRDKLRTLGLLEHFGCVVCVDTAGCAKPDARIFHQGCQALGLAPDEVAYVGNLLDVDAVGARDAGLRGVWLDRDSTASGDTAVPDGVSVVQSLTELPQMLLGRA